MTVTVTYDSANSRVAISATALAAADVATIERSVDGVRWTTVRGATALPVAAGVLATHYDYEWYPNASNTYRVRGISTAAITFVAAGASSTGSSGSRTPGLPAGMAIGDKALILASTRNSGTGTVDTPTNWELLGSSGNFALLGREYDGVWTMPTVTYTGGAANEDTIAQSAAWRNIALTPVTWQPQLNSSAQNIAYPALNVPGDDHLALIAGWKQDDFTSVATLGLTGAAEIGESSTTAGNDASQVWDYQIQDDEADIAAGSFVVTGGASAISRAITAAFEHAPFLNEQTASVTPTLTTVQLKSPQRPFLNTVISLGGKDFDIETPGRGSANDVLDNSLPPAVTQLAGSDRYTLLVRTATDEEGQRLKYMIASGDVVFLHAPTGKTVPANGVYLLLDSSRCKLLRANGVRRHWSLQVKEVRAPGPDVAYALSTWATVLALYATWADLLAANATWADVLSLLADPSEVIVA